MRERARERERERARERERELWIVSVPASRLDEPEALFNIYVLATEAL